MSESLLKRVLSRFASSTSVRRHRRPNLNLEALDSRRVPAALTATLSGTGVLQIDGTDARDVIAVQIRADKLTVGRTPIQVGGVGQAWVSAASVTSILVNGFGGDDTIDLHRVDVPAEVHGGAGNDVVSGGSADDELFGDDGNDVLRGRGGADDLFGGAGNDTERGDSGDDHLNGEAGDDRLNGGDGNDDLVGDDGDDRLSGNAGDDQIEGGLGDDSMLGGAGDDSEFGGAGDDRGVGDSGDDNLFGDSGNDSLFGGADDDLLSGDDGDDQLNGNGGTDDCQGGLGDDRVRGDDHAGSHAAANIEGTITAIDLTGSTVTIQTAQSSVVVSVSSSTVIERNGDHVTLDAFQVGDPAEAKFDAQGNTLKIEAGIDDTSGGGIQQGRVEGTITAIDLANSVVAIKTQSGSTVNVSVGPNTKVERNDVHATLAEFKVGDACEARFDSQGLTLRIEAVGL